MIIHRESAAFGTQSGLQAAGDGIGISFKGTSLRKPLTLVFEIGGKPSSGLIPVVAHLADSGGWDIHSAMLDHAGHLVVTTSSFSVNIPSWANPVAWWHSLASMVSSALGGRTSPLTCSGAPGWFHLSGVHSDLVHVCAKTNQTSDGQQVAEVQIRSNRGVSLDVTVPGKPIYVWVQDQSWDWRRKLGSLLGFDPNRTVILPAGANLAIRLSAPFNLTPITE